MRRAAPETEQKLNHRRTQIYTDKPNRIRIVSREDAEGERPREPLTDKNPFNLSVFVRVRPCSSVKLSSDFRR